MEPSMLIGVGNIWPIDVEHFLHILIVRKEGIVLLLLPHKLLIVAQGLFHIHLLLLLLVLVPIVLVGSSCFDFTLLCFPPPFAISHSKLHALCGAPPPHRPPDLQDVRPLDVVIQERNLHQHPQPRVAESAAHPRLDHILPRESSLALHS
ncbi:unnamed protein product [Closterium sp. NIES-54]